MQADTYTVCHFRGGLILTNKTVQKNKQTKPTSAKQTMQNSEKLNYPGSVASYNTRPVNEMVLFYNILKSTWDIISYRTTFKQTNRSPSLRESSSL